MSEKWIQGAHLKEGAYSHGHKTSAKKIARDIHSGNSTVKKRAVLARTFRRMAAAHKRGKRYHGASKK